MLGTVILGEIAGICYMFHVGAWDRWNLHFNMAERMATEGRVLFSYWGKILCPHTGNLTINADTIVTSDLFILYFFVLICLVAFMFSNRIWSFAILCFCFLNIGEFDVYVLLSWHLSIDCICRWPSWFLRCNHTDQQKDVHCFPCVVFGVMLLVSGFMAE